MFENILISSWPEKFFLWINQWIRDLGQFFQSSWFHQIKCKTINCLENSGFGFIPVLRRSGDHDKRKRLNWKQILFWESHFISMYKQKDSAYSSQYMDSHWKEWKRMMLKGKIHDKTGPLFLLLFKHTEKRTHRIFIGQNTQKHLKIHIYFFSSFCDLFLSWNTEKSSM